MTDLTDGVAIPSVSAMAATIPFVCECGATRMIRPQDVHRVRYCAACQRRKGGRAARLRWEARHPDRYAAMRANYAPRKRELLRLQRATPEGQATNRARAARYLAELKEQLHAVYGDTCVCCGETERVFLTFDHPASDGAQKRREYGGAQSEWRAVRRMGFPAGYFVVLCFNCNMGRERNGGMCPHQQRQRLEMVA